VSKEKPNANGNRSANPDADLEQDSGNAALSANEPATFRSQVRITFHHTRARLADIDGLSGKAAIDGLVEAGILAGDSAKQVAEVRHCQTKGVPEETKIIIETID
jgi:hypothetical protein